MGSVPSTAYNFCRRMILRYNVQNRAYDLLDKETLPTAPRHPLPPGIKQKENPGDSSLKHIHEKSEELSEHLKKVYLTSTSKVIGTPSKRPLPKKENERPKKFMFYEPEKAAPGQVTLTNVVKILLISQEGSNLHPYAVAKEYDLDKEDATNLIAYYSLFKLEDFQFMNAVKPKKTQEELKALESSEFQPPTKQIPAK